VLHKLKPKVSNSYEEFYTDIWDPEDYAHIPKPVIKPFVEKKADADHDKRESYQKMKTVQQKKS